MKVGEAIYLHEEELLEIRGMGEKKFKKYGEKLIELLKED